MSDHYLNFLSYRDHFIGQKFDIFFCFLWVKRGMVTLMQNVFQQFHGLFDVKLYCQLSFWLVFASNVITSCNYVNQFSLGLFSWFFLWKPTSRKRPLQASLTGGSWLYQVKYLDAVVFFVTHNYLSVTKICCRIWMLKLSPLATFTSKLCNKLSTQFKYLNSVIECITNSKESFFVNWQIMGPIELSIFASLPSKFWN